MILWCDKCNVPVFDEQLHKQTCNGNLTKISEGTICNPVFKQERKLLSKISGQNLESKTIWYLGASNYFLDGKLTRISYRSWYKEKRHLKVAEELRNHVEIERDYISYRGVVEANKRYIQGLILDAEKYVLKTVEKYKGSFRPTISFSGGKDSTVVSRLVRDSLQDNTIIHFFGDTTLEFPETHNYVEEKFKEENPEVYVLPSESENDFFQLCKVFGPPSQY